jgi:hypothetical protein
MPVIEYKPTQVIFADDSVGAARDLIFDRWKSVQFTGQQVQGAGGFPVNSSQGDLILDREAADALALRRSVNPQVMRIYNTYTDTNNYERLTVGFIGAEAFVVTQFAGTGQARNLRLNTSGGGSVYFGTQGGNNWLLSASDGAFRPVYDNNYDLGTAAYRVRNIYVASSLVAKVKAGVAVDGDFTAPADGMFQLDSTNNRIYFRVGGVWRYAALT